MDVKFENFDRLTLTLLIILTILTLLMTYPSELLLFKFDLNNTRSIRDAVIGFNSADVLIYLNRMYHLRIQSLRN